MFAHLDDVTIMTRRGQHYSGLANISKRDVKNKLYLHKHSLKNAEIL